MSTLQLRDCVVIELVQELPGPWEQLLTATLHALRCIAARVCFVVPGSGRVLVRE